MDHTGHWRQGEEGEREEGRDRGREREGKELKEKKRNE